jgi:hypothetical protein
VGGESFAHGSRFAGEVHKDALGDVAGQIGGFHLAQGGGVNEVRVTAHDLAEGGFIRVFGVFAQQLGVGLLVHLTY